MGAPEAGFTWDVGDFDGEESVNARRISRGSDAAAMHARSQLLRYNEDDCRATAAARHWLRGCAGDSAPGCAVGQEGRRRKATAMTSTRRRMPARARTKPAQLVLMNTAPVAAPTSEDPA